MWSECGLGAPWRWPCKRRNIRRSWRINNIKWKYIAFRWFVIFGCIYMYICIYIYIYAKNVLKTSLDYITWESYHKIISLYITLFVNAVLTARRRSLCGTRWDPRCSCISTLFCVKYKLRLKKQLSIKCVIQHTTSRWQHSKGRNQRLVCSKENKRPKKKTVNLCVNFVAVYHVTGKWLMMILCFGRSKAWVCGR